MWDIDCQDYFKIHDNGDDEYITPEEFMRVPAMPDHTIRIPEEFVAKNDIDKTEHAKNGDISRLLQVVPGILPPVECFPASYVPPVAAKQPDMIMTDKIPILLHEKFFKFKEDPPLEPEEMSDMNNTTDIDHSGGSSISCVDCNGNKSKLNNKGKTNAGSNDSDRKSEADIRRRYWTVFSNSDDESNNVPVKEMHWLNIENDKPKTSVKQYYTPYEIYMKKRGNKEH